MKVTTERLEDCQVNIVIEVDAAEIDKYLRQTARKISRQFTVPGYRRGRAPFHAVIRVFGREAVQQEALEDFGQDLYEKAIDEIEYEPFQPGELQEVEWDPFRMTVLLPIRPEVDLGEYRAVQVPLEPEAVTEDQIEEYLANLQLEHSQWVPVERPAALGDRVTIDAEGKIGDDVVLSNENHELLLDADARHPLPGFHEQIVGMSPGDDKAFELTYPEDDFQEEVAGKEASFVVHLHTVKEKDQPPVDDELAMMVGDYDTLDDLKQSVRERLETESLQRAETDYLDKVLEAMIDASVGIEYPPQAVDHEAELALDRMERNLASSGLELDRYLGMMGKTRDMYKLELRPAAEERLKKRLALIEIARSEGIEVEEEEIEAEIDRLSELMGDQAEEMREMFNSPGGRLSLADDLTMTKVQELVVQIGKGEAPPLETGEETEDEPEAETEDEPEAEAGDEPETEIDPEAEAESEETADTGEEVVQAEPEGEETS